jgi:hypothetical protein
MLEVISVLLCSRSIITGGDQWWTVSVGQALGCENSPSSDQVHRCSHDTESTHCLPLSPCGSSNESAGQNQTMGKVRHMWFRSNPFGGQLSIPAQIVHRPTNACPSTGCPTISPRRGGPSSPSQVTVPRRIGIGSPAVTRPVRLSTVSRRPPRPDRRSVVSLRSGHARLPAGPTGSRVLAFPLVVAGLLEVAVEEARVVRGEPVEARVARTQQQGDRRRIGRR